MTVMTSDDRWRFCAAYNGKRHESVTRYECLVCGAKFNKSQEVPFAGQHPDTLCPIGITPPKGDDDQKTI